MSKFDTFYFIDLATDVANITVGSEEQKEAIRDTLLMALTRAYLDKSGKYDDEMKHLFTITRKNFFK